MKLETWRLKELAKQVYYDALRQKPHLRSDAEAIINLVVEVVLAQEEAEKETARR